MKILSIIIPVYNEKETVREILRRVAAIKPLGVGKEIIIVDDYSTDGTREILKKINQSGVNKFVAGAIKIFYHARNLGKGAAVRTGFSHATGDYLIVQDADLEYDPQDIPKLLRPIQEGKAQAVYGSRFTGEHRNMFFWHMMGNQFLSLVTNLLFNTTLSDMEVCYKLITQKVAAKIKLEENRWGFDPEITAKILKQGVRIYEVPISYAGREFSEGKKISWKDGFLILWVLMKYRFLK